MSNEQQVGAIAPEGFPDPTPNENYTVAGVTAGAPTPETDKAAEQAAREALGLHVYEGKFANLEETE